MHREVGNRWRARCLALVAGRALAVSCLGGRGDMDPAYAGNGRPVATVLSLPDGRVLTVQYDSGSGYGASSVTLRDIHGNVEPAWGDAGTENRATTGRLSWADGDGSDRAILIELHASARSGERSLKLRLSAPQGGTWTATDRLWIAVQGTAACRYCC